jgi:hypothetical protein
MVCIKQKKLEAANVVNLMIVLYPSNHYHHLASISLAIAFHPLKGNTVNR